LEEEVVSRTEISGETQKNEKEVKKLFLDIDLFPNIGRVKFEDGILS